MNGFLNFLQQFRGQPDMQPDMQPTNPAMPARKVPKAGGWRDKAYLIGAGLRQASADGQGNELAQAQEMFAQRGQQARLGEIRASLPPEQQALFDLSPEAWVKAYGMPQQAPEYQTVNRGNGAYDIVDPRTGGVVRSQDAFPAAPKPAERIEGPDGIYEKGPDGQWKKVATFGAAPKVFAPPRPAGGAGKSGGGVSGMTTEDLLRALRQ